jgi:hypothetical protein
VVANRVCYIDLATLRTEPFSLVQDDEIIFKVSAANQYGESDPSDPAGGATVVLVPDAPLNLVNDPVCTNAFTICFWYEEGANDGSSPVLDFDIYYDKAVGDWALLESGVEFLYYQTSVALIPDLVYSFKVAARNSVGYSEQSEAVSIRAARIPDVPVDLMDEPSVTNAYQIGVSWSEGAYNGGSVVLDYELLYKEETSIDWLVWDATNTARSSIITGLSPSLNYNFKVRARNIVGYSAFTEQVTIKAAQIPDAPSNLVNLPDPNTRATKIGLSWTAPSFDGGSPLLGYSVWFDNGDGSWQVFASGITQTQYIAEGLTQGVLYAWKVQAINAYGYSADFTNTVSVLAA